MYPLGLSKMKIQKSTYPGSPVASIFFSVRGRYIDFFLEGWVHRFLFFFRGWCIDFFFLGGGCIDFFFKGVGASIFS